MPIRNLSLLTAILTAMIVVDALWNPVVLSSAVLTPDLFRALILPRTQLVDGSAGVFKLATIVMFCVWIYQAGRNLVAAGFQELEFTPASRIWWFAVPIASLFKPFQGMRELWNASHDVWPYDTNNTVVSLWWALWLVSGVLGTVLRFMAGASGDATGAIWAQSVSEIACAVIGIILIQRIARAQRHLDGSRLDEVFA